MILVDTSVWVDHLKAGDDSLSELLHQGRVLMHPFVLGELALGSLRLVLESLQGLPNAIAASDAEVLVLIETAGLSGVGIGYVDAHLLASVRLTPDASLWTRDKRLAKVYEAMRPSAFEAQDAPPP
jgi:predicted nucleic acid-binding protein